MTNEILAFIHRFEPGAGRGRPPLSPARDRRRRGRPAAARPDGRARCGVLSPRGAVLENGMPRFFRRLAEGVFDEADLRRRADDLADFVAAARQRYGWGAGRARLLERGQHRCRRAPAATRGAGGRGAAAADDAVRRAAAGGPRREAGADPLGRGRPDRAGGERARVSRLLAGPALRSSTGSCRPATACPRPTSRSAKTWISERSSRVCA